MNTMALAQFTSASSAAITYVLLGFVPDFVIGIFDTAGTSPNIRIWLNVARVSQWAAALDLLITGTTGVVTRDTTGIAVYNGGDTLTSTLIAAATYVNRAGTAQVAGKITEQGISVPIDHQTNSGANVIIAFRAND